MTISARRTGPCWIRARPGRPLAALLLAAALAACSHPRPGGSPTMDEVDLGWRERGVASWYGKKFHGRPTASGERYDMHALTAAHRTLPFGTVIEVENLDNGRRVTVTVNDRGPFVRGRTLDLSYAAAREIAMLGPGTARVEVRVVDRRPSRVRAAVAAAWAVQVGAFRDGVKAHRLERTLRPRYPDLQVTWDGVWHRVQIGPFDDRGEADRVAEELAADGLGAWVRAAG